ncbi:zinc finger protein 583-like isoform X2 [Pleurodeles waltl]|uniref:zinc finger protein 583-like isoform X2 n=1 Tax=Pleurodeles waltl TaxID=8319 RepID=UPI003709B7C3
MPVTFHDAAVHFSAEEWTQLHEWQKELYRKVMKEIHQALISLGPIIAATVFSLQAKENGDLCIVDIQDSERQQCGNPSASAVISTSSPIPFWVTTEENDCLKGSQDSDRLESSGNLSPDAESQNMYEWNPATLEHHALSGNAKHDDSAHFKESEISRTLHRFKMSRMNHTESKVQIKSEQVINKMNESPQPGTHADQLPHVGTENEKKVALRRNQQTPRGLAPFACTECGKVFRKHSRLTCHLRVHFGEKPYICMDCGKGFNDNSNFKRHLRIHSGKKPYTCNTCGKDFTQANHLNVHERLHTGEKPHACPICGKLFAHDSSLSKHQLTHTGRKPFQCSVCCKSFRQRGHLNIHLRAHTGERPFQCTKCEKTFIVKKHLLKHQTTHKDMNPPFSV